MKNQRTIKIHKDFDNIIGEHYYARFVPVPNGVSAVFSIIGKSWNTARTWKTLKGAKGFLAKNYPDCKVVVARK